VLVPILSRGDDAAVIAVMDFALYQGEEHATKNVPIVARDKRELAEVHGLIVFHLGADAGETAHGRDTVFSIS
jgi:hypothetical protein